MTESEKMKLGLWYDANYDQELSEEREKAEDLYFTFNHTAPKEKELREAFSLSKRNNQKKRGLSTGRRQKVLFFAWHGR